MKNIKFISLVVVMSLLFTNYVNAQEEDDDDEIIEEVEEIEEVSVDPKVIKGSYDGFEGGMHSFKYKNEDNDEDIIFFNKIQPEVSKLYDLKNKKYEGKAFEITYETREEEEIDDDGDKQYNRVRTITGLKLLD